MWRRSDIGGRGGGWASRRRHAAAARVTAAACVAAGLLVMAWGARAARACGPFFPNQVLLEGDGRLLAPPVGDLSVEVGKLKPKAMTAGPAVPPTDENPYRQSIEVDQADLAGALKSAKVDPARAEAILRDYAKLRAALAEGRQRPRWGGDEEKAGRPAIPGLHDPSLTVPAGLPAEFDLYIRGLLAFRRGQAEAAREKWLALLALPPEQRKMRSVWAAYMMGRSFDREGAAEWNAEEETRWYARARDLAREGFSDHLGLAVASVGWEAKAELFRGKADRAVELYLVQADAGDPTAVASLRVATRDVLAGDAAMLRRAAARPIVARAVNASLVSSPARGAMTEIPPLKAAATHAWLEVLEAAGARDVGGADLCAWAAYQAGDAAAAKRWVERAPADAPVAQWIRAKLLLRAGKVDAALEALAKAARLFPAQEEWSPDDRECWDDVSSPAGLVRGDSALLRMARREYVASLDALLRGGYWLDAAYVAERVLTPDELKQYVDKTWPVPAEPAPPATEPDGDYHRQRAQARAGAATNIRELLARRLTRLGRWREAGGYFSAKLRPTLDAYVKAIRAGNDASHAKSARADSLWEAAKIARHQGMDLLGTELDPDWRVFSGSYDLGDAGKARTERKPPLHLAGTTPDEAARANSHRASPDLRFHYRYIAAEHAWAAAALMPDESEETARRLCVAGGWLKGRDPAAAEKFYKALVTRCGRTALGREAAKAKWFPKLADDRPVGMPPPHDGDAPER